MLSLEAVQIARHEADHAAALFVLLGADCVGSVARDHLHRGTTRLADLPMHRHPALNAADLAVVLLVPILDPAVPAEGCESDVRRAYTCAEVAYRYRPEADRTTDPEEWGVAWVHGTVTSRAKELLDSVRFRQVRTDLEFALHSRTELGAADVRRVLGGR